MGFLQVRLFITQAHSILFSGGLVGVLEQRNRSILIHTSLVLSILFTPVGFGGEETSPKVVSAAAPASKFQQGLSSKAQTEAHLPPALVAFLYAIIGPCNLGRRDAVEPKDYQPFSMQEQLTIFKTAIRKLPEIYGNLAPYSGPPIQSLPEFIALAEPTRVYTGSLRSDLDLLYRRLSSGTVQKAAKFSRENFADVATSVQAEIFLHERQRQAHRLFLGAAGSGVLPPTVVASILKGVVGVLLTSGGLEEALRRIASAAATVPTPPPTSEADGKTKQKPPPPKAPENHLAFTLTLPAAITGLGLLAGNTADALDFYRRLSTTEDGILEMMQKLDQLEIGAQIDLLEQMQRQIRDVAMPQLDGIGIRAAKSPELAGVRDPRMRALIGLFFSEYPRYLETDAIMNIVLNIMQSPLDTSDVKLAGIMLQEFDPITLEFFQTVTELGEAEGRPGEESIASELEAIRDSGKKVPYAQIAAVIEDDPNNYPLQDISIEAIKAGKLFQVHTANWRNHDGSLSPVIVRVLKPGIEGRLDRARIRLRQLAPRLSHALRDPKDGTGPSPRRVEQLVDMIYRNLLKEVRVDLTVENQNRAAARLETENVRTIRGRESVTLRTKVPKAYPALAGSKVMVMERVLDPISLKDMKLYHPEALREFASIILGVTLDNSMAKPMRAALGLLPPTPEGGEDLRQGFMHADMHSGNELFTSDTAWLLDFGLVVLVEPEQVEEIVKLGTGASYNSAPFIIDAIWSLRDDSMNAFKPQVLADAKAKLQQLINRKVASLNRDRKFLSPADWIKYVWFEEAIDLPDWVVLMEHGFRALMQSYLALGKTEAEYQEEVERFGDDHRGLIYKYLAKKAPRHAGWSTLYRSELATRIKKCKELLLGKREEDFVD
jgi:hypothetical protein